ncbi:MAG: hypothetical protein H6540_08000 [Bacteroidales bacterium]|nr:hypothetical protein [Bacteroidales bacterium]
MNFSKTSLILLTFFLFSLSAKAQFTSFSGGLTFGSGVDYNTGTTGNPGIFGKAYLKINKRFYLVPALSAYNKYKRPSFSETLKTYMFHADFDGYYALYKDKSLRFLGFAGINATYLSSKWDILLETPASVNFRNQSDIKPGVNLGGAFHLYVNDQFDAYLSAKYIISPFSQAVINVGAIYYLGGERRRGNW